MFPRIEVESNDLQQRQHEEGSLHGDNVHTLQQQDDPHHIVENVRNRDDGGLHIAFALGDQQDAEFTLKIIIDRPAKA
ncbi:hypothetical protein D3C85_1738680 [compost metagenome]